jgi:hypothetical protein
MTLALKLRPFEAFIAREAGLPALELRGYIRERVFIVAALGQEISLQTLFVSAGVNGCAWVHERTYELPDGFKLAVESERREHGMRSCRLHLYVEHGAAVTLRGAISQVCASDMLTTPHYERSFYACFCPRGELEHAGSGLDHESGGDADLAVMS